MKNLLSFLVLLVLNCIAAWGNPSQDPAQIRPDKKHPATLEVITNEGRRSYHLDNTGEVEISAAFQSILDEVAEIRDVSATFIFSPGIYYLNNPVTVRLMSIKMQGQGHGGIDIHGANLASGTVFQFGELCGPECFLFDYAGRSKAFPSGESPWPYENLKVELENLTFVGYNNTGVDTDKGYSRFRGDNPNFRGLSWYPAPGRYGDVEKEGQRAVVLKKAGKNQKCELLRVRGCYFTDLYVALEIASCDVCYIHDNWFGQLTYGIRYQGVGQSSNIHDNLFADLETGMVLAYPVMSAIHHNTFAYVSKCFVIDRIAHSTISGNTLFNWNKSTGAAAHGAFCYIADSENLVVSGNSVKQDIDSRTRTITTDAEPNGRSFIQFDNPLRLNFSNNVVNTTQTQSVIRLHNARDCLLSGNIITFGEGGNGVAETGNSSNNQCAIGFKPYIY